MGIQADYVRKIQGLLATAESLADQGNDEAAGAYVAKAQSGAAGSGSGGK